MTTTAIPSAVTITGLSKSFGDKIVLDGIDLDISPGTIFSLLGPNGAGKTTAVEILSTLLSADAGEADDEDQSHDDHTSGRRRPVLFLGRRCPAQRD
jgi:ABC-2 type transport system ATP-binding protein